MIIIKLRVMRPVGVIKGHMEDLAMRLEPCGPCRIQVETDQLGGVVLIVALDAPSGMGRQAYDIAQGIFDGEKDGWVIFVKEVPEEQMKIGGTKC